MNNILKLDAIRGKASNGIAPIGSDTSFSFAEHQKAKTFDISRGAKRHGERSEAIDAIRDKASNGIAPEGSDRYRFVFNLLIAGTLYVLKS